MNHPPRDPVSPQAVAALRPVVVAYLTSLRLPLHEIDDFAQETLTRVLEARARLSEATLAAYAIAVVRNVVRADHRANDVEDRHRHRLYEPEISDPPDDDLLRAEEQAAMREAIAALPASAVARLLHDPVAAGSRTPSARAQLARDRSLLRVEYVTRFRRQQLPTPRCGQVLRSLSARDSRRQEAVDAGRHLLACSVCSELAPALVERRRRLAGVLPLPFLGIAPARSLARGNLVAAKTAAVSTVLTASALAVSGAQLVPGSAAPVRAPAARASVRPSPQTGALVTPALTPIDAHAPRSPMEVGVVYFAAGSAVLDATAVRAIDEAAVRLRALGARDIAVSGFASSPGGAAANAALSAARARVVMAALLARLGPGAAVSVHAGGERDPATTNSTATGRADNQRVLITTR